jgi:hypothetical protein
MGTPGTPNIEIWDPWSTPLFLIPLLFRNLPPTFPSYSFTCHIYLRNVMESESELESESVGSSDEEDTFALLRFPAVNGKPLHRSRSYRHDNPTYYYCITES